MLDLKSLRFARSEAQLFSEYSHLMECNSFFRSEELRCAICRSSSHCQAVRIEIEVQASPFVADFITTKTSRVERYGLCRM